MPQKTVAYRPSLVGPGQLASTNRPISAVPPESGRFVAGKTGLVCGNFAWDNDGNGILTMSGTGAPVGLVRHADTGVIVEFMGSVTNGFQPGQSCMAYIGGDFGANLSSSASASVKAGDPVFTDPATGSIVDKGFTNAVQTNFIFRKAANPGDQTIISGFYAPQSVASASSAANTTPPKSQNTSTSSTGSSK